MRLIVGLRLEADTVEARIRHQLAVHESVTQQLQRRSIGERGVSANGTDSNNYLRWSIVEAERRQLATVQQQQQQQAARDAAIAAVVAEELQRDRRLRTMKIETRDPN